MKKYVFGLFLATAFTSSLSAQVRMATTASPKLRLLPLRR